MRRPAAAAAAALLAAAVLAPATPSYAHRGDPAIVARVDTVDPPIPDAVVEVRAGIADQLLVVNMGGVPVEVLGTGGRPFLRVHSDRVEADLGSPDWPASNHPFPTRAGESRAPNWTTVATTNAWGWFDHRMHDTDRSVTPDLRDATSPVRLADWTVPLRRGGTAHTVRGHVEYRPVRGAFRSRVTTTPGGVELGVLDGRVPGLFLRWRGDGTLLVKGIEGEPFARFTRGGVEVNERSATWRDDRALRGQAFNLAPGVEPRWASQGREPSLTWLDRRLAYAPGVPPDAVARRTEPTTMVEWDLPAEVDGRPVRIAGETAWHPTTAGDDEPPWPAAAGAAAVAVAALAAAAALRARGRRRATVEQGGGRS